MSSPVCNPLHGAMVLHADVCADLVCCLVDPQVPIVTTIAGAKATTLALKAMRAGPLEQVPLQSYFPDYKDDSNYLMIGMTKEQEAARR